MSNLTKYEFKMVKNGMTELKEFMFYDDKMAKRYGALQVDGKNHGVTFVEIVNPKGEVIYSFGKDGNDPSRKNS